MISVKNKVAETSELKNRSQAGFFASASNVPSKKSDEIMEMAIALGGIGFDTDMILSQLPSYVFEGSRLWSDNSEANLSYPK